MTNPQPDLFAPRPELPRPSPSKAFDGKTYDVARDYERLDCQLGRVFRLMKDGRWRTLAEIADAVDGSATAVSARLRDFRKDKYGGHQVPREFVANGVWRYRLIVNRSKS
jgi:hypothetical protein